MHASCYLPLSAEFRRFIYIRSLHVCMEPLDISAIIRYFGTQTQLGDHYRCSASPWRRCHTHCGEGEGRAESGHR